jgi:hypothetical protein
MIHTPTERAASVLVDEDLDELVHRCRKQTLVASGQQCIALYQDGVMGVLLRDTRCWSRTVMCMMSLQTTEAA